MNRKIASVSSTFATFFGCCLFCASSYAGIAEEIRGLTDPNTRIVEEMKQGWVGKTDSDVEKTRDAALARLEQSAKDEPNNVAFFHVLYNQPLSQTDTLEVITNTFVYVDQIVFKQYDPETNDVWTTSVSDFEMYKAPAEDRLDYIAHRAQAQVMAVATNAAAVQSDSPLPPQQFNFAVYEIYGYATYDRMHGATIERESLTLHIQEQPRRTPYRQVKDELEEANGNGRLLDIPQFTLPQAAAGI